MCGFLLLLLTLITTICVSQGQPISRSNLRCGDWTPYKDEKCVKMIERAGSQNKEDAEDICRSFTEELHLQDVPHLVTVTTAEKQLFLHKLLFEERTTLDHVWLGLDMGTDGILRWNNETELYFTNWVDDNLDDTNRKCVQMESGEGTHEAGKWVRANCKKRNAVVCERDQPLTTAELHNIILGLKLEMEKNKQEFQAKLNDAKREADQMLRDTEMDYEKKLRDAKQELDKTNKEIVNMKQELNKTNEEVETSKQVINRASEEIANSKQELNKTKQQVINANQEINKANQEISNAKQEINKTNKQVGISKQDFDKANQEIANAKQEILKTNQQIVTLKQDINKANQEIANAKQETVKTNQQVGTMKQDINKANQEIANQKQENLKTSQQVTNAKQEINKANQNIANAKQEITKSNQEIVNLKNNPVPIGFVFVQLPGKNPPTILWPQTKWKDVSSEYAGLFFRVEGGNAAKFGVLQEDNTRRIDQIFNAPDGKYINPLPIPTNGAWSDYAYTGRDSGKHRFGLRFRTTTGEVRPRNKSVKIWQRIA